MKNIRFIMLCVIALLYGATANAQGIKVYKTDGTTIEVSYSELDSIVGVPDDVSAKCPVITLGGHAGDVNGEKKDSHIMFSLSCTSRDASYAEMFVALKNDIDVLIDNGYSLLEIADANMGNGVLLSSDELDMANTDVYWLSLDNTDGVIANTEYTCIAYVMNTAEKKTAVRYDIKTDASQEDDTAPTIVVDGRPGNAEGELKSEALTFTASCTSKNASYAEAFIAETSLVNAILGDMTLEELMTYNAGIGNILPNEDLDKLNSSGISLTWDQLLSGTEYSLLFSVKTKGGGMAVTRCDVSTEGAATAMYGKCNMMSNKGKIMSKVKSPR